MIHANVNQRDTLERFYPRAVFEREAGMNSVAKATVLHGVRILSAPDEAGAFAITRASRHVGEEDPEGDTVFLHPFLGDAYDRFVQSDTDLAAPVEKAGRRGTGDAYADFIDRILDAARSAHFKDAIGRGEPRLRGFHGG